MNNQDAKQLEQLIQTFGQSLELNAKATEKFGDEIMRLRAWEAILYLFFTRYYLGKDDSMGLAIADRDFLANSYREHGKSEEGARHIEAIYQTLRNLIETSQRHEAESHQDDPASPPEYSN